MGVKNSKQTRDLLIQRLDGYAFISHIGDLAYADDESRSKYEEIWNLWQSEMQPIAAYKPYMTLPGNHDIDCNSVSGVIGCQSWSDNCTAYNNRFRMPSMYSGGAFNMWYSFNYSNVRFIMMDTETDFPKAPEGPHTQYNAGPFGNQIAWLEQELKAANQDRKNHPWLIVSGHRPFYSIPVEDWPIEAKKNQRDVFEQLLIRYKVDLYFCGHVHGTEILYPMVNGTVVTKSYHNVPPSINQVLVGHAGCIEGHAFELDKQGPKDPRAWGWNGNQWGYAELNVISDNQLEVNVLGINGTTNAVSSLFGFNLTKDC